MKQQRNQIKDIPPKKKVDTEHCGPGENKSPPNPLQNIQHEKPPLAGIQYDHTLQGIVRTAH